MPSDPGERGSDPAGQSSGTVTLPGPAARSAALDFYTNKSTRLACSSPRIGLRLRSSDGLWACVRCGLNSCYGCYGLKSLARAQMVYEDALVEAPSYAMTLTTRAKAWDAGVYRRAKSQVLRSLRQEYGSVEMLEFIEQTSGAAPRSGGHKRGHGHNLVKGIPHGQVLELERLVVPIWKRCTGAWHVNVAELQSAGGAVAYLTLNLALEKGKATQAPVDLPKGTRTLRPTRGYWSLPAAELAERARDHHAMRRLRHALVQQLDDGTGRVDETLLELATELEWERHKARTWVLWQVNERPGATVFEPVKQLDTSRERLSDELAAWLAGRKEVAA